MNSMDKLLLAAHYRAQMPKVAAAGTLLGEAARMTPGVGTALMGYDAFNDFRKGNWLGGAGNLIGAGLTLIPGAGGFLGRGISGLARLGGRSLIRAGAPTLGRVFGRGLGAAGRGMSALGNVVDRGVASAGNRLTGMVGNMPRFGGVTAKTMSGVGNFARTRPGTTGLIGFGATQGLNNAQAGVNEARATTQATQQGYADMLSNMRRSPVMTNPMFAGGGQNMRLGF